MAIDHIELEIQKGNYSSTIDYIKSNDEEIPIWGRIYLSQILELTGHFEEALKLAKEVENFRLTNNELAASYVRQAYALWRQLSFEEALSTARKVSQLDNVNMTWNASSHNIAGLIFWKTNEFGKALNEFKLSHTIRTQLFEKNTLSYTLNNIGNTFLLQKDFSQAEDYFNQAYEIRSELKHLPAIAGSLNSYGRLFDAKGDHEKAFDYHKQCLNTWQKVGNKQFIAKSYRFLGLNAYYQEKDEAVSYFRRSNTIFSNIPNPIDLAVNKELTDKLQILCD